MQVYRYLLLVEITLFSNLSQTFHKITLAFIVTICYNKNVTVCYISSERGMFMKIVIKTTTIFLCLLLFCGSLSGCIEIDPVSDVVTTTTTEESYRSTTTTTTATTTTTTKVTTTTTKKPTTTTIKTTTSTKAPTLNSDTMVWIPTKGGTKYHKKASCSNMENPEYVSLTEAKNRGFTACGRCYK